MNVSKMMLMNAYNNWSRKPAKTVVGESVAVLRECGFTVLAFDDVPPYDYQRAMEEYNRLTDWSCFSVADWEVAMALLSTMHKAA